jgi:hypothetical protein
MPRCGGALTMTASMLAINSRDSAMAFSVAARVSAKSAGDRRMKSAHSCRLSAAARIVSCACEKWNRGICRSLSLRAGGSAKRSLSHRRPLAVAGDGFNVCRAGRQRNPAGASHTFTTRPLPLGAATPRRAWRARQTFHPRGRRSAHLPVVQARARMARTGSPILRRPAIASAL